MGVVNFDCESCGHDVMDHADARDNERRECELEDCACGDFVLEAPPFRPRLLPVGGAFVDPSEVVAIEPAGESICFLWINSGRKMLSLQVCVSASDAAKALGLA